VSAEAPPDSLDLVLPDHAATSALGRRLGEKLAPGETICLSGGLGAGKTTLARGAISAWTGSDEEAPSPSYTLVETYSGPRGELWHVDLYRLKGPDEVVELGLDQAFAEAACLIEWPERLEGALPRDRLDIVLSQAAPGRRAALTAHGVWRQKLATI